MIVNMSVAMNQVAALIHQDVSTLYVKSGVVGQVVQMEHSLELVLLVLMQERTEHVLIPQIHHQLIHPQPLPPPALSACPPQAVCLLGKAFP